MGYFYSNEIVFRGHPDKVCDQISDALLDAYLQQDRNSRCGIETIGGKGKIFITGEVASTARVNVESVVKSVLSDVGYSSNYEIINNIGVQSPDIAQGVDIGGAGDQGMMFGYACRDTENYVPTAMAILQRLSVFYDQLRKTDSRFLPDGKAQITGRYDGNDKLDYIKDFVISYQNTEQEREETDKILKDFCEKTCAEYGIPIGKFHINPTGKFLIGGFEGDAGLTGRKIVVDNYQSFANVGGGAFSGKDFTKVDRSGAYKARQLAIQWLKEHKSAYWCEVQLSYAIGLKKPLAVYIRTNEGDFDCTEKFADECTPKKIIKEFGLNNQSNIHFYNTAQFGHFGHSNFPWEIEKKKSKLEIVKELLKGVF